MNSQQIETKKLLNSVSEMAPNHVIIVSLYDNSLKVAWSNTPYMTLVYMQYQLELEIRNKMEMHNKQQAD